MKFGLKLSKRRGIVTLSLFYNLIGHLVKQEQVLCACFFQQPVYVLDDLVSVNFLQCGLLCKFGVFRIDPGGVCRQTSSPRVFAGVVFSLSFLKGKIQPKMNGFYGILAWDVAPKLTR